MKKDRYYYGSGITALVFAVVFTIPMFACWHFPKLGNVCLTSLVMMLYFVGFLTLYEYKKEELATK